MSEGETGDDKPTEPERAIPLGAAFLLLGGAITWMTVNFDSDWLLVNGLYASTVLATGTLLMVKREWAWRSVAALFAIQLLPGLSVFVNVLRTFFSWRQPFDAPVTFWVLLIPNMYLVARGAAHLRARLGQSEKGKGRRRFFLSTVLRGALLLAIVPVAVIALYVLADHFHW